MAAPISWVQEVITCDFCDNQIQQFCSNCQVSLCEVCVNKHVKKHKSLTHDIVPFKNRKMQLVFPVCEFHLHQRCEAHCQQCDVPVCMKCVIASHNGHRVRDLPNIFNVKKEQIQRETQEIESSIIPKYRKKNEDTERDKTICLEKCNELEKETEKHRKIWHQEVDSIFNKVSSFTKSTRDNHLGVLKSHQSKLKSMIPDMIQTVKENKEILKSNKLSEVTNYKSKLTEYRNIHVDTDVSIPSLKTKTLQGRELSIELGEYKATLIQTSLASLTEEVSDLSTKELLDKARVIFTIPTVAKPLLRVACVGADKAWVSGIEKSIRCVDIHGSVQETVTTTSLVYPNDISVTRQGDPIYSDYNNRTVNIFRHGRSEIMITTPMDWNPSGLYIYICCTESGDILVSLGNGHQNKIVRYQGQSVKQEIFKDENGKQIYQNGQLMLYVAENNNEDVCVSDTNAKNVVLVDKTGRVRFRYDGTPLRRKKAFTPTNIATDSTSQIIVVDYRNGCLHILNQDGQFLRCVDNCGLSKPCGLSLDSGGRIWVGLLEKGGVKVIQYMK